MATTGGTSGPGEITGSGDDGGCFTPLESLVLEAMEYENFFLSNFSKNLDLAAVRSPPLISVYILWYVPNLFRATSLQHCSQLL